MGNQACPSAKGESQRKENRRERKSNTEQKRWTKRESVGQKGRVGMFFSQRRNETEMSLCDELAICKDGRPDSRGIN